MTATSETREPAERELAPAEAFGVIANESRLDILESLWNSSSCPIRFSELFDGTELSDGAQFNYHPQQLTETFVVKTEAGYDLSHTGGQAIRVLRAGTHTHSPDIDPFEVSRECTRCTGPLVADYEDEQFTITCQDCGKAHGKYSFPPGGLDDRTEAEIATAFDQRVRHLHCLAADGVCSECALPWCVDDTYYEVRSTDPWEIEVAIPLAGEQLRVALDEELQVVETARESWWETTECVSHD